MFTPAGGDTTKSIDFDAFDEDAWYPTVIGRPEVRAFIEAEDIDFELLCATIHNKGPLGSILDLVDKLAYTSRDTINFDGSRDTYTIPWDWRSPRRALLSELTSLEKITGVWQSVEVDDSGVVISDPHHLFRFLHTRANMFRHLYTAAEARHHESLIARTILSFLYDTGQLSREWLLEHTDHELRREVGRLLSERFLEYLSEYQATYRSFTSLEEARDFERSLLQTGNVFVQTEDVSRFFKPGTHFRVRTKTGVQTFATSAPQLASRVAAAGSALHPIRVYFIEGKQPPLAEGYKNTFRGWRHDKFQEESHTT